MWSSPTRAAASWAARPVTAATISKVASACRKSGATPSSKVAASGVGAIRLMVPSISVNNPRGRWESTSCIHFVWLSRCKNSSPMPAFLGRPRRYASGSLLGGHTINYMLYLGRHNERLDSLASGIDRIRVMEKHVREQSDSIIENAAREQKRLIRGLIETERRADRHYKDRGDAGVQPA